MKPPFDLSSLKRRIASWHDPRNPVVNDLPNVVVLPPISNASEASKRWSDAQHWCRANVDCESGDQWCYRRNIMTDELIYSFSSPYMAFMFKLLFR